MYGAAVTRLSLNGFRVFSKTAELPVLANVPMAARMSPGVPNAPENREV